MEKLNMKTDWLVALNLERTHEAISSINTLLIHAKLALADVVDPTPSEWLAKARENLLAFLSNLQTILNATEKDPQRIITGTDPRLSDLAADYQAIQRQVPQRSVLYQGSLDDFKQLVEQDVGDAERTQMLIHGLQDLRGLLEVHVMDDYSEMSEEE
jgi:hypothetical protein